MNWQPIATAPKDADKILLYSAEEGFDCGYWEESVWLPKGGAWIIYLARSDTAILNPTHWMPLPEPPK